VSKGSVGANAKRRTSKRGNFPREQVSAATLDQRRNCAAAARSKIADRTCRLGWNVSTSEGGKDVEIDAEEGPAVDRLTAQARMLLAHVEMIPRGRSGCGVGGHISQSERHALERDHALEKEYYLSCQLGLTWYARQAAL